MRTLVLMRGSPGCGKTTWIKNEFLTEYALSADNIRQQFASPELDASGKPNISQKNDKVVWETLFQMLERRMQRGDFTIIDACNSKASEMKRYKALADQYRYRMYCVDMTDVPIEVAKGRNRSRKISKIVPEEYIDRVYSRFETQKVPSGITVVRPEDFDSVYARPIDLSQYDRVVHIGDIHGCYDAIQKYFGEDPLSGIDPNTAYIFVGDYSDRGANTPAVLRFLIQASEYKNVCLLEGNHEAHLWAWANDQKSKSREFEFKTRQQLDASGISKADVRRFYRRLRQCSWYTWRGKSVLCTHGGISGFDGLGCIDFVPSYQMIKGVGAYEDMVSVAQSFDGQSNIDFQVFGHRNVLSSPPKVSEKSIVLEGGVERGGALRVATLSEEGWSFSEFTSDAAVSSAAESKALNAIPSGDSNIVEHLVNQMRQSKLVIEKQFGHISSFNFSRAAFNDKRWNNLTVKARGLYIDTANMKVAARGYEKFFAVDERQDTTMAALAGKLKFPVEVFKKENGFLGMMSFDRATDALFVTTKSTPEGDMAKLFDSMIPDDLRAKAIDYLKDRDVTLLFEVIHPALDPHIIEYDRPRLFLLDAVKNKLSFEVAPYDELIEIGEALGVETKQLIATLDDMGAFMELYERSQSTLDAGCEPYEGFVLRDAAGFMVKVKTDYYTTWKRMRSVADRVSRIGYIRNTSMLTTPLMNHFYAFVKEYYAQGNEHTDIIALRNLFYQSEQAKFLEGRRCQVDD